MFESIREYVTGLIGVEHHFLITLALLGIILVFAIVLYYVAKLLLGLVEKLVSHSSTQWDDDLLNPRFLQAVAQLAPAMLVKWLLPGFFEDPNSKWISTLTSLYILVALIYAIIIFLSNLKHAFQKRENLRIYATSSIFQTIYLIIICIGAVFALSIIIGKSPLVILTALGASAAVLMLVFKDTILGLVASVQLSANRMLKHGDWIVAEKHNADGVVVDVTLTAIKVRNWDASITTIPPYSLVTESFRNYEPMVTGSGRRVTRCVYIDANTVGFCTPEQLNDLESEGWLEGLEIDRAERMVNFSLLRLYLVRYLANHPFVARNMTQLVRQMEPTPSGLPLQLYFFTNTTEWAAYERIQCEVFDHIYAVIRRFGLRVFQTPAGRDIQKLSESSI